MLRHLFITTCILALVTVASLADQTRSKVTIPVTRTDATNGQQMYTSYCSPCHGIDGKGHGTLAPSLQSPVADLTMLSRNHHGRYPDAHIYTVLLNGVDARSHGGVQMPVWGPILGKMNHTNSQDRMLRINNLARFLETLQAK